MRDLFGDDRPLMSELYASTRRTDPKTSHEAAAGITSDAITDLQGVVHEALSTLGPSTDIANVALWHYPDLRLADLQGLHASAFRTLGSPSISMTPGWRLRGWCWADARAASLLRLRRIRA